MLLYVVDHSIMSKPYNFKSKVSPTLFLKTHTISPRTSLDSSADMDRSRPSNHVAKCLFLFSKSAMLKIMSEVYPRSLNYFRGVT